MAHLRISPSEELAELDRKIVECEQRISEQEHRICSLRNRASDDGEAGKLYRNLVDSLRVLWELRELVKKEAEDAQQ
jgi:hypothetical protein